MSGGNCNTLHVFLHPHRHDPEPLCGSEVTQRVAAWGCLPTFYLDFSKHEGFGRLVLGGPGDGALDHPLGFVDLAVKPCQTSNKVMVCSTRHFVPLGFA